MIGLTLILKWSRGGLMRAADLDIHELLHFVPEGGRITFAGERVLLLDAVALGLLRKELIETLGAKGARARGGDARLGQPRRPGRRRHLARIVRGGAASAASRTGGGAGLLDPGGLRQWLHVMCLWQGGHRHRRPLS